MNFKNGLSVIAEDYSQPITVMKGSVLGSRHESGEKVRKYRQKKHKAADDDSSDTESQEPSHDVQLAAQLEKANGAIAVADQNKDKETR